MPANTIGIPKDRQSIHYMVDGGGLYVYVENPERALGPKGPVEGTGAIVWDGPPVHVTARMVAKLRRLGTEWDAGDGCERLSVEGRIKARAYLEGRDVLIVSSDLSAIQEQASPGCGR